MGQGVSSRLPANYPTNPLAIEFLKPTGDVSELWLPDLGDRIRQKRRQLGITLVELADHIGVSLSAAVYWERLSRPPRKIETRQKLLTWLNKYRPDRAIELHEIDGDMIKTERLRRRMSIADLAKVIRVSVRSVRDWEHGNIRPQPPSLRLLREWLEEAR